MYRPHVQLLAFDGCPLADASRRELERALAICNVDTYEDVDISRPTVPASLRGWGSPTILIDGQDVAGESRSGDGLGCRAYAESTGVPDAASIAARIRAAKSARR